MNYLAAGWFTPKQGMVYNKVCDAIKNAGLYDQFFIPRDMGINLQAMKPEERMRKLSYVFALDFGMIVYSHKKRGFMLAIIDDFDTGMVWEIGAAFGMSLGQYPIVTYSDVGYGLNVMIRESVMGHIKGISGLNDFLREIKIADKNMFEIVKGYQDFSDKVF